MLYLMKAGLSTYNGEAVDNWHYGELLNAKYLLSVIFIRHSGRVKAGIQ
jgi:hypothetical protein